MIIQSRSASQLHFEPNMRTKDTRDRLKSGKSRAVPIHIRGNQLDNPGSETQETWKRDYVISSNNNNNSTPKEGQTHTQISSGGCVALVIALAVALAITVLVAVYFVLRRRYGPGYTVRNFFGGARPQRDQSRDSKTSSVPLFIETELARTEALPKRGSTKLKKPMQQGNGRRFLTKANSSMMAGAVFAPGQGETQDQPQFIQEPDPVRYSTQRSAISAGPSRLSTPSVTTWSSFLYMYSSTPPPPPPPEQEHGNQNHNINSNNAMATTSRRKQPPSPLGPLPPYTRNATDNQRAMTPCSPCSNRTQVTTTTQSSGPIPSIYKLWIGRDTSRASTTTPSGYGDCRWSYCQNHYHHRPGPSVVGSEDRVVSLPSPSPMLRNMIRPRAAPPPVNTHVYQMMRQSPHGEQQARDPRQSHFWETDSYYCLKENEVPRSSRYRMTGNVDDNGLPMLPRSVFVPN